VRERAFAAHRAAASGLFTLFTILAIVLGLGDARLLALAMGGALVSLFALTRPQIRESLGPFAAPLAILVDLGLLFCAMSLTGGALSPYALLLPAGAALSWHCEGRPAARFFAVGSVLGVAALVTLGDLPTAGAANLFPLVGVALAAPALLIALEVSGAAPARAGAEMSHAAAELAAGARGARPAAARELAERDHESELLHDLRSPLSVIRVYTDLIQEAARRGELPNAEYLANLAREIDLAERLVGTPAPEAEPPAPPPQNADLVEILGSLATAYRLAHGGRVPKRPRQRDQVHSGRRRGPHSSGRRRASSVRRRQGHRHGNECGGEGSCVRLRVPRGGRAGVRPAGQGAGPRRDQGDPRGQRRKDQSVE
jgi:hypothetical protein